MNLKRLAIVLLLAAVLAVFIRTFFFETIRVTSPAMSQSQQVGNRLLVEKLSLGARLPLSLGIPFAPDTILGVRLFFELSKKPYRLWGFSDIRRNDLIAFNSPVPDKMPIDRHTILLSRCVGLPGELIRLEGSKVYINDEKIQRPVDISICYRYSIVFQESVEDQLKFCKINQKTYQENGSGFVYLTNYEYHTLAKEENGAIELRPFTSPFDERLALIPYKGFRITLNDRSFKTWGTLINHYEGVRLVRTASGRFRKNGKEADFYQFKQNYYWLLNDHQGYLDDSRSFGLIPESHLIGKASVILFSPSDQRVLQKI